MFNNFFSKLCHLWDNAEKHGSAGRAADDNIVQGMLFACWMTKARKQTHTQNV